MSHYTVAVLTKTEPTEDDIYEALAPFDENMEVEKYVYLTKEEIIKNQRERLEENKKEYKEYLENPEEYKKNHNNRWIEYLENEFSDDYQMTDEEIYKERISSCDDEDLDEDGSILSTYNPNSKWDWFVIGGRWSGAIKTKSGKEVNSAKISDIEFGTDLNYEKIIKEHPDYKKEYEDLISGESGSFFKPEYYKEKYPTIESYIDEIYKFSTYALLDLEGNWHEPGQMGWFGCSSASASDENNFKTSFYDNFIKDLPDDCYLTVVDCHI